NPVAAPVRKINAPASQQEEAVVVQVETLPENIATIHSTPHQYELVSDTAGIIALIEKLMVQPKISFDTETTGTDANRADLVGLSFSWQTGTGYYIPLAAQKADVVKTLEIFQPLFNRTDVLWIGQNIKYDMLMLKWYGFALKG